MFGLTSINNSGFRSLSFKYPIILPNLRNLNDSSFRDCRAPYVHIGERWTSISGVAHMLGTVFGYLRIDTVSPPNQPSLGNSYPIYVPDESVDAYQNKWTSYSSRIKPLSALGI